MKLFKFLMVALLLIFSINAYSTSFDCVKARSVVEKSICSNASLSTLDDQLTAIYSKAFKASSAQSELKKQELDWIKTKRNICTTEDCISAAYTTRIAELNLLDQPLLQAAPASSETQAIQSAPPPSPTVTSVTDSSGLKLQTIKTEGVGSTVELAAQNAAQNALMQVVGSFIDVEKKLDKKTEIADGIRNETKSISTNIKDYSQGTIKGFKVLDSKQESGLTRVTAEVVVRIDDFHAYIKKLAEAEVAVDEGLFVKMKSESKQQTNQASLLFDNIISPIVSGEVIEFKVGEPKSLSDIGYKGGDQNIDKLSVQYGNTNIIAFRVSLSLKNEFTQNMHKTLESIATKKTTFNNLIGNLDWHNPMSGSKSGAGWDISPLEDGYNYLNDTVLIFHDGKHVFAKTPSEGLTLGQTNSNEPLLMQAYLFSNSKQELVKKAPWLPKALSNHQSDIPTSNIEISLTGSEGVTLQKEMFGKVSTGKLIIINGDYGHNFSTPWSMIGLTGKGGGVADLMVWENRSFLAFIAVDPEAFAKTKKIIVKLVN
jgi:uncharacterized protein